VNRQTYSIAQPQKPNTVSLTMATDTSSSSNEQVYSYTQGNNDYYYDYVDDNCNFCQNKVQKLSFKEYCNNDIVLIMKLIQSNIGTDLTTNLETNIEDPKQFETLDQTDFSAKVQAVIKYDKSLKSLATIPSASIIKSRNERFYEIIHSNEPMIRNQNQNRNRNRRNLKPKNIEHLWMSTNDLQCNCPIIKLNRRYLVMSKKSSLVFDTKTQQNQTDGGGIVGLSLKRDSFIIEWRGNLAKRLRLFNKYYKRGRCERFKSNNN
jgi:hypothetical protein